MRACQKVGAEAVGDLGGEFGLADARHAVEDHHRGAVLELVDEQAGRPHDGPLAVGEVGAGPAQIHVPGRTRQGAGGDARQGDPVVRPQVPPPRCPPPQLDQPRQGYHSQSGRPFGDVMLADDADGQRAQLGVVAEHDRPRHTAPL